MPATQEDLGFETRPRYAHSCRSCTFLGLLGEHDLYFCKSPIENTVIAKFGVDGNYASGMDFAFNEESPLTEARRRAQKRGLMTYPVNTGTRRTAVDASPALRQELKDALSKSPEALALELMASNPLEGTRRISALAEAEALRLQAQFRDKDLVELRSWVFQDLEQMRQQMQALQLPVPEFFAVYQAVNAWSQPQAAAT